MRISAGGCLKRSLIRGLLPGAARREQIADDQIEAREFLQIGVTHALQFDFEPLFEFSEAGLIAICRGACGRRRVIAANLPLPKFVTF